MTAQTGGATRPQRPSDAPHAHARALVVDDGRFDRHTPIGHHPERPERLRAARAALEAVKVDAGPFEPVAPREASDDELARVHEPRFIESLARLQGQRGYLDPDTYVSGESVAIARLAAGSIVAMVDTIIEGPIKKGVALVRPPGHHARPGQAMGFCLLNNVAIAAAHARARGLERIAVVDWDVHHGNGTQEIFLGDPHVLYVSTHQHPFYPGTGDADEVGRGEGTGYTVNVPLAAGSGDSVYAAAFERIVLPILESYGPELVLVSAGFDASAADPLAQMELSAGAFGRMAGALARVADRSAHGRMALVLEGGYDLSSLQAGLHSSIDGMLSPDLQPHEPPVGPGSAGDLPLARAAQWASKAWPVVG
jgi:acetoin utilization deacetylase AcuC-like enzyme